MSDLIDRQAAIEALANGALINYQAAGNHNGLVKAIDVIKGLPSAQPERKTGRWIYGEDDGGQDGWTCSECGFFVPWYYDYYGLNNIDFIRDFHTCPHCDAKMLTYTGKEGGGT